MALKFQLGEVRVEVHESWTTTFLPGGHRIVGLHQEQHGQSETARELGMSAWDMNREHDLLHSILAHAVGLECSPALLAAATGQSSEDVHGLEEAAVLSVQKWLASIGRTGALLRPQDGS